MARAEEVDEPVRGAYRVLYMRVMKPGGKRSWVKVGQYVSNPDEHVLYLQVHPGKVYHARFTDDDLVDLQLNQGR